MVPRVVLVDYGRLELPRKGVSRENQLVADILRSSINVASELELRFHLGEAVGGPRPESPQARDGVDVLLDDVGDVLLHDLGAGALLRRPDLHNGKFHVRKLIDAETVVAEHPEDDERQHHHPGEDRAPDRDVGKAQSASSVGVPPSAT